jgi:hypothetical protein
MAVTGIPSEQKTSIPSGWRRLAFFLVSVVEGGFWGGDVGAVASTLWPP